MADAVALAGAVGDQRGVAGAVGLGGGQVDRRRALRIARHPAVKPVLEVRADDRGRRWRHHRSGDENVIDQDRVGAAVGGVGAADVDLDGRRVDAVGEGVGAGDGGPAGRVDRGVAHPVVVGLDHEPDVGRTGNAIGQLGPHREGVRSAGSQQARRRLDAFVVLGAQDAQRHAATAVVDVAQGRASALGPGAQG